MDKKFYLMAVLIILIVAPPRKSNAVETASEAVGIAEQKTTTPPPPTSFYENLELKSTKGLEKPIDPNTYYIVVGDKFLISLGRKNQQLAISEIMVLPEGKVLLPFIGEMRAQGLLLADFTRRVNAAYAKVFPDFKVSILLEELGTYSITVIGAVARSGIYEINSVTRLSNTLLIAGGIDKAYGSLRKIEVRCGGETKTYDLFKFFQNADFSRNPYIEPRCVVNVPPRYAMVSIEGEVFAPGVYEILEGETILDLLAFAKGFTTFADRENVLMRRYVLSPQGDSLFRKLTISMKDMENGVSEPLKLADGDRISVYSYAQTKGGAVEIYGAVKKPGSYDVYEELTLKDLIYAAGGLSSYIHNSKALYISLSKDGKLDKEEIDLTDYPEIKVNPVLTPDDKVYIFNPETVQGFISIEGAVVAPGYYPFLDGQTAYEVVNMAGGIKYSAISQKKLGLSLQEQTAAPSNIEQSRGVINLKNSFILRTQAGNGDKGEQGGLASIPLRLDKIIFDQDMSYDLPLIIGDRIIVATELDQVIVNGNVEKPGMYPFIPNMKAIYYINMAGILNTSDKKSIMVSRAGGEIIRDSNAIIFPGDAVSINEKAFQERERKFSFYSGIVTTIFLIYNTIKK